MPVYSFRCPLCGSTVDKMQKYEDRAPTCSGLFSDTEPADAITHEAVHMNRIFGVSHIAFKGSGFYSTDYKTR